MTNTTTPRIDVLDELAGLDDQARNVRKAQTKIAAADRVHVVERERIQREAASDRAALARAGKPLTERTAQERRDLDALRHEHESRQSEAGGLRSALAQISRERSTIIELRRPELLALAMADRKLADEALAAVQDAERCLSAAVTKLRHSSALALDDADEATRKSVTLSLAPWVHARVWIGVNMFHDLPSELTAWLGHLARIRDDRHGARG